MIVAVLIAWVGGLTAGAASLRGLRLACESAWAAAIAQGDMRPEALGYASPHPALRHVATRIAARRIVSAGGWALVALASAAASGAALFHIFH